MLRVFAGLLLVSLTACPPDNKGAPAEAGAPVGCTKVGQSCEVSPGKLGSCVQLDDCSSGAACFRCQSQH